MPNSSDESNLEQVWQESYDDGDIWRQTRVTIKNNPESSGESIAFFAHREEGKKTADIALDDISITEGACPGE